MAEQKSLIEIVLMPLVVALVGIGGTYFITAQQEKNAQTMREAQLESTMELAKADRQVKILEIFAEKITSGEEDQRILALRLLRAVDDELAAKLATAVSEGESIGSEVKKVAAKVAEEAATRAGSALPPRIYVHIQDEESRPPARSVAEQLQSGGFVVPGIEKLSGPSSSELRYFRKSEEEEANQIVEMLESIGVHVRLNYVRGHEESGAIRPRHYELWFASGEPRI